MHFPHLNVNYLAQQITDSMKNWKHIYRWSDDVDIIHTKPLYSGYGIDQIMRMDYIKTEYIVQLHADCIPININWGIHSARFM